MEVHFRSHICSKTLGKWYHSSFFFLRVLRVFAVHSFFRLLALFFKFFLTNREGAKSAKKEEEEELR
jgi:hypothetical protein